MAGSSWRSLPWRAIHRAPTASSPPRAPSPPSTCPRSSPPPPPRRAQPRGRRAPGPRERAAARALPREHLSAQLTALAAAEVLGEGLRRTGRELTRERLIEQLEGFRKLQTAYAPNRKS